MNTGIQNVHIRFETQTFLKLNAPYKNLKLKWMYFFFDHLEKKNGLSRHYIYTKNMTSKGLKTVYESNYVNRGQTWNDM